MIRIPGRYIPLGAFVALYFVAFSLLAVVRRNEEFIFYLGAMVVMIASVMWIHRAVGFTMPLLWLLAVWGLSHLCGGLIDVRGDVLYNFWFIPGLLRYDHLAHAYGFAVATWACWQAVAAHVRARGGDPRPTPGIGVGLVLMGTGLGALNEVIEFIATLTLAETNVGGYENTAWDLVANLIGSTLCATVIVVGGGRAHRARPAA
ncbi:MAG: hypothetical protein H6811_01790 [Phycisphaeraceae bacterium]|nr:hypothetical protein [Phycisphaeraceae bacterium]